MDKTIADKLMYITNYDTQNYPISRLKLVVETFKVSTLWSNYSKFTKVPKVVKKLWGLV